MADLATPDDLALLLGLTDAQAELADDLLTALVDGAEGLFEADTGRAAIPFRAAQSGRVEIRDGSRSRKLWLDYPVATVTAIAIGVDVGDPAETLAPADARKVVWRVGARLLTRTDGGSWGGGCWPAYVKVTYDAQADLPEDAKAAVLRLAAAMWGQRATLTAGIASETLDNYSVTYTTQSAFADVARQDPAWAIAVARHRRLVSV